METHTVCASNAYHTVLVSALARLKQGPGVLHAFTGANVKLTVDGNLSPPYPPTVG